jgi:hypothetical protein
MTQRYNLSKLITSKQIIKISETWVNNIKGYDMQVPLYVNPDSTDKKELYKAYKISDHFVRFIADGSQQKVWVWDGTQAIHSQAMQSLGLGNYSKVYDSPNILLGYAHLQNGNITFDVNNKEPVDHLIHSVQSLNSFLLWGFSDGETKQRFGTDIKLNYNWLSQFFTYNWSFLDRYISGMGNYISQEKSKYQEWCNNYAKRLL